MAPEDVRTSWFGVCRVLSCGWLAGAELGALELGWDTEAGGLLRHGDQDGGELRGRLLGDRDEALVARAWDTKLRWARHAVCFGAARVGLRQRGAGGLARPGARLHLRDLPRRTR
jgi:hypothetical protein